MSRNYEDSLVNQMISIPREEEVRKKIFSIVKQNPKVSYRSILLLLQDYSAEQVWTGLKNLRAMSEIEMVKINNKKVGYQVQTWCLNQ